MKKLLTTSAIFISLFATPLFGANEALAGKNIAKQLSDAFAQAARKVTPATVFIVSEGESFAHSQDPFDFFGDDLFRHFFGHQQQGRSGPRRPQGRPQVAQGSGFVVSPDGYIMTNHHVVQNTKKLTVTIDGDKSKEYSATFIGSDPQTDTAVIKLDEPPKDLPFLEFTNSDEISVGEWVLAVGSPFALEASVTTGIVSAKGRKNLQVSELEDFIQTDAAINPGNSGGPMVNLEGKVVGINTAIVSSSNIGIGFAVPSNIARNVMEQIIQTGTVTRGQIGVTLQQMDKDLAESFGLKKEEGVIVADVVPGSAGDKAGLRQGDIVISIDGKAISSPGAMRNEVMLNHPGTEVTLKVLRDGEELALPVILGSNSDMPNAAGNAAHNMGLTVEDLNSDMVRQFRLSPEDEGVVVVEVQPGSVAARAGIRPGAVIMSLEHERVYSVQDFNRILNRVKDKNRLLLFIKQGNMKRFVSIRRG